jgi:hypothetical protein
MYLHPEICKLIDCIDMTQPNLLELAKQGNPQAIAALMNRQLQPKGISAKAQIKDNCLQIMLESPQAPDQQALVAFIRKGMTTLGTKSIKRVKIYGRQTDEEVLAWSNEFDLGVQTSLTSLPASSSEIHRNQQAQVLASMKRSTPAQTTASLTQNSLTNTSKPKAGRGNKTIDGFFNSINALETNTLVVLVSGLIFGIILVPQGNVLRGFLIQGLLALIPAKIASSKGKNFLIWYAYGFLLFIIALVHVLVIKEEA